MDTNTTDFGLVVHGPQDIIDSDRVLAFDLDHTIIKPRSGRTHPTGSDDWAWCDPSVPALLRGIRSSGVAMVIFTNQAGVEKKRSLLAEILAKLDAVFAELGFGVLTLISVGHDRWRKPSPNMFARLVENYAPCIVAGECTYTGDAAGRDLDFSADDLKFASNCGMKFRSETEWYRGAEGTARRVANPYAGIMTRADHYDGAFDSALRECGPKCVIMVGRPASGKSTIVSKYFRDYVVVSQDTVNNGRQGTKQQCLRKFNSHLMSGRNVAVDNTCPSAESRSEYLSLAHKFGYAITIVHMDLPEGASKYLNKVRAHLGGRHVPDIAYGVYNKKFDPIVPGPGEALITIQKLPADASIMTDDTLALSF